MKKSLLFLVITLIIVILVVIVLVFWKKKKIGNIDITETNFDYQVDICDKYFELAECIIDRDTDERFTRQMRIDLKNEVKLMQEKWKNLTEEELFNKCTEELAKFDSDEMKNKLKSFGCSL